MKTEAQPRPCQDAQQLKDAWADLTERSRGRLGILAYRLLVPSCEFKRMISLASLPLIWLAWRSRIMCVV
ncbi:MULTISPECIES: hypothetical protein [Cupriavidus]|uniref:hypothetical protein n=1 Tax=Cupriavidus sp. DF5525 TaxID=3160989 RepID=UPI0003AFFEA4|nr:hypothetical protein N234_37890 [Ralstonia pickettii DTP0602]